MKRRLGWIGPVLVVLGLLVGGVGIWWIRVARPVPGDYIDVIALPAGRAVAIRHEAHSERAMLELWDRDGVRWQALIPAYAGHAGLSGIGYSKSVVSARVVRGGKPEVFGFTIDGVTATKTGNLSLVDDDPGAGPLATGYTDPQLLTLTDGVRSYEWVRGEGWAKLFAIDLDSGKIKWMKAFDAAALAELRLDHASFLGPQLMLATRGGQRFFDTATGAETTPTALPLQTVPAADPATAALPPAMAHPVDPRTRDGVTWSIQAGKIVAVPAAR